MRGERGGSGGERGNMVARVVTWRSHGGYMVVTRRSRGDYMAVSGGYVAVTRWAPLAEERAGPRAGRLHGPGARARD